MTIRYLSTAFSPIGLWQLDGNMSDSSGQGNHLSVSVGTARFGELVPGMRGFLFDGSTTVRKTAFISSLAVTGALTTECLVRVGREAAGSLALSGTNYFVMHGGDDTDTGNVDNVLFGFGMSTLGVSGSNLTYFHESGSGVNVVTTGGDADGCVPGGIYLLGMTRSSASVLTYYINGQPTRATSTLDTIPNGGTSGRITLGAFGIADIQKFTGVIASVKLMTGTLTAIEMQQEYNYCLGEFFPIQTP